MRWLLRQVWPAVQLTVLVGSIAATLYLSLVSFEVYGGSRLWEVIAILWLAFASLGSTGRSYARQSFRSRWQRHAADLRDQLDGLVLSASELTNVNIRTVHVRFFVLRRRWAPKRFQRLECIARRGFGGHTPSKVQWTPGKGVIGVCWEHQRSRFHDLNELTAKYGECDERAWAALPRDTRLGLTWSDWRATRAKYGTIVAVPVLDRGDELAGVLTVNFPVGADVHHHKTELIDAARPVAQLIPLIVY